MNYEEVKELIAIIDQSTLKSFELHLDNAMIKMSKTDSSFTQTPMITPIAPSPVGFIPPQAAPLEPNITPEPHTMKTEEKKTPNAFAEKGGNVVKAPIVGTFYQSAGPEKPPFVKIGSKIKAGDILCVIEAMKIMNEITSPYDGEIVEIFVQNEDLVEYGQPLFRIS